MKGSNVLKRLRRKFIIITMSLVGLVLIGVLGSSLVSTANSLNDVLNESLDRALKNGADSRPMIGSPSGGFSEDSDGIIGTHMLIYVVDVDSAGVVLTSNGSSIIIDDSALQEVLSQAASSTSSSGSISDLSLSWKRTTTTSGIRIAIADTSTINSTINSQIISSLVTVVVAMGILFVITWFLSKWALEPVEKSWDQQRRFVADASHELKTPLSVILANSQILRSDEKMIPAKDVQWIDSTADEAEHMKGLVNDLLELAKTDENTVGELGGAFQSVDVDLSGIAENTTLQFDAVAFERGCSLESDIHENVHVTGDPIELERLMKTLIDNACKYALKGSAIDVRLANENGKARFSVTNQGTPIDPEDLPHVFERFYRSDKARSRETGGYGLGLAIAKGIVDAHHGTISVTSTAEDGTCFSFLI